MLSVRPRPLPDEVFASWVQRLAISNGHSPRNLLRALLGRPQLSELHDFDRMLSLDEAKVFARATGLALERAVGTSLRGYEGSLVATYEGLRPAPWLVDVGVAARGSMGYAYCPACWHDDETPFLRRRWRLAFHTICPTHTRLLVERCPACFQGIFPLQDDRHAAESMSTLLHRCKQCGHDLRDATPSALPRQHPAEEALMGLCRNLEDGALRAVPCVVVYPFQVLAGVRALVGHLLRRRGDAVVREIERDAGLDLSAIWQGASASRKEFERMPLASRHVVMSAVLWLLDDWPARFLAVARKCRVTRGDFKSESSEPLPYWLASVIRQDLDRARYSPSPLEIFHATRVAEATARGATKLAVKRLLGVTEASGIDHHVPVQRRKATPAESDQLLTRVLVRFKATPTRRDQRRTLGRDFAMLMIVALSDLDVEEVCALPLTTAGELLRRLPTGDSELATKWAKVLRGRLQSYLRFDREVLCKNRPASTFFVSRFGRALEGHSVRSRICELIKIDGDLRYLQSAQALGGILGSPPSSEVASATGIITARRKSQF